MSPETFWQAHYSRIEAHAARVRRELNPVMVECVEHPEWGVMTPREAADRRGGGEPWKLLNEVRDRGRYKGVHWCKAGQRKRFVPKPAVNPSLLQRVKCIDTGVVYASIREAADAYGLRSRNSIREAARLGRMAGGVRWRMVGRCAAVAKRKREAA